MKRTEVRGYLSGTVIPFDNAAAIAAMTALSSAYGHYADDLERLAASEEALRGRDGSTEARDQAKWARRNHQRACDALYAFVEGDDRRGFRLAARTDSGHFGGTEGQIWLVAYRAVQARHVDIGGDDLSEVRRIRRVLASRGQQKRRAS